LQGSVFSSQDAQRHRLGPNFKEFPINQVRFPVSALAALDRTPAGVHIEGNIERSQAVKSDDFAQAGEHYRAMSPKEQDHLVDNILDHLMFVDESIQKKVVAYFMKADETFGARIARGLDF